MKRFIGIGQILFFFIFFSACSKQDKLSENVLVKFNDKIITVDEFKRRAEYTIRPPYCRLDNNVHKKIILNSLIAEKLLAHEAGEDNELARNEQFRDYIQGRKEQAMRQWFYYNDAYAKATPDTNILKKVFKVAGRKYNVSYFTLKDSTLKNEVEKQLTKGVLFESVFKNLEPLKNIPTREINYELEEHPAIHDLFYSDTLSQNQIIGPVEIEENYFMVFKIEGWTDNVVISSNDIQNRWKKVKDNLTEKNAAVIYRDIVKEIMKNKSMEFHPNTFRQLVNIVGPYYWKTISEKKNEFQNNLWQNQTDDIDYAKMLKNYDEIADEPLLILDNEVWTIRDFQKEVNKHPLVFRKRDMQKKEFADQLKLAIVDMIRDKFVTQEAYNRNYDEINSVKQNEAMWKDNLLAMFQRNQYLKSVSKLSDFNKSYLKVIENDLKPYIDQLQEKYSRSIYVNVDKFNEIELTRVEMYVIQRNVAFPIIVPGFPLLTTDQNLDYGNPIH